MRRGTVQTDTRVANIHFASDTPNAKYIGYAYACAAELKQILAAIIV